MLPSCQLVGGLATAKAPPPLISALLQACWGLIHPSNLVCSAVVAMLVAPQDVKVLLKVRHSCAHTELLCCTNQMIDIGRSVDLAIVISKLCRHGDSCTIARDFDLVFLQIQVIDWKKKKKKYF